jgi:recombination protein RecA
MSASQVFSSAATGRPFIFSPPSSPPRSTAEKAANAKKKKTAEILAAVGAIPKLAAVVPASRLDVRPAPEMVSSGIPQLDSLTGGLARGCLTEICGTASSGRTSVLLLALARATQRGEVCALVDASDSFDPASAAAAGMEMSRLLWVRCGEQYPSRKHPSPALRAGCAKTSDSYQGLSSCDSYQLSSCDSYQGMSSGIPQGFREGHDFSRAVSPAQSSPALAAEGSRALQRGKFTRRKNPESQRWESQLGQMLKVTDLLLQSNGFGMIALDLGDVPVPSARRIPLASWFRFRRAIEHTPTALLVLEQQPIAGSCSSVLLKVSGARSQVSGNRLSHSELAHSELLDQFEITAELLRSRLERNLERKPVQSTASFKSRAAWAG